MKVVKSGGDPSRVVFRRNQVYGPRQVGAGADGVETAQTYDLVLPASGPAPDAPFFLFVHGGAWCQGSKEQGHGILSAMAKRGFVGATMNYALCAPSGRRDRTFAQMLQDIDLMVSHIPRLSRKIGLSGKGGFVLGGASAGGHLALLYAYDAADPQVLKLKLKHALPVACVYSDCGPTDLASPEFSSVAVAGIRCSRTDWLGQLSVLTGGLRSDCDYVSVQERLLCFSPRTLVTERCPPTICLYGETRRVPPTQDGFWTELGRTPPALVGSDGLVATQNYTTFTNCLAICHVPFAARLEPWPHCQALAKDPKLEQWLYATIRVMLGKRRVDAQGALRSRRVN